MSKLRRTRLALGTLALMVPLAIASTPAAFAASTTGGIVGHLSTNGQPRTDVTVFLWGDDGSSGSTSVDGTGTFHFTGLAPAVYRIEFWYGNGLEQWYRSKPFTDQPGDPVTVVAGQDTDVEDTTLPTGTIAGTLTDSNGQPVASAQVGADSPFGDGSPYGSTDASGHFSFDALPGRYVLSFRPQDYPTEYAPRVLNQMQAQTYQVTVGNSTTVNEQLLPTGSISGRYTTAGGQPVAGEEVDASTSDFGGGVIAVTDAAGNYTFPHVYAGTYQVSFFNFNTGVGQYAHGKLTKDLADSFAVTKDANTVVNDTVLPTGTITVTASDAVTRRPLADFCAGSGVQSACSNGSGRVVLSGVQQGPEPIYVYTNDGHYFGSNNRTVNVTGGSNASVSVRLAPGATINTVIKDAVTGAPVANACVAPSTTTAMILPDGFGYCSDAQGTIHIGPLDPGSYRLYAVGPWNSAVSYGAQWVGPTGGVGTKTSARTTALTAYQSVTVPPILLDHAGTISGTVTDAATGHPLANAFVGISSFEPGPGPSGPAAGTDANGHFTLTGLGPYSWPLFLTGPNEPDQWTGGTADHATAATVKVQANTTVTYNPAMVGGVHVSGTVRGTNGALVTSGRIIAYNATSGDVIGVSELNADSTYQLLVLGSQSIKLRVEAYANEPEGWFGGVNLATATSVAVPAHADVVQNVVVAG